MAKKGLDEFKDVGGCWGCGLQLQLNQDLEDIKQLKAENERLKEEIKQLDEIGFGQLNKCKQTLQEIREIAEKPKLFIDFSETKTATEVEYDYAAICNELELRLHKVLELITKAEEE
jgi:cell division septum initiation protein DivIVA